MLAMMTFLLAQATATPEVVPSTSVSVPWGDWIVKALSAAQPIVTFALTGVATYIMAAYMPPWLKAFAGDAAQRRVNQVLEKAVLSAVAQTKDAVAGKSTSIPVASEILARAAQYAINQAPDLMKTATHGEMENLLKMIMARMEQFKLSPPDFDIKEAKKAASDFHFTDEITKQLGK
jgi:hypothetical protein